MYLPCATAPRSSDKFVVPSSCGQHRPAWIYEVRRFTTVVHRCRRGDVMYYTDELTMADRVTEKENILVHIDDFIEREKASY